MISFSNNRVRTLFAGALIFAAAAVPSAALAQEAEATPAITVSGSVALVSDYRLRGVSQSNNSFAIQGGISAAHESGFYAGFWSSSLSGWGTFGGPNVELDLFGGYKLPVGNGALDLGLIWYMYPGGADKSDFAELTAKLSGTAGPVGLLAGIAFAPSQESLGNWSNHPDSRPGDKENNLYLWGDATFAVPETPLTLKAHIGRSKGNPGLGPNGTSIAPTGSYWDWLFGADAALGPVVLGISYVGTDISRSSAAYQRIQPNFSKVPDGGSISSGRIVFSVSAAF